MPAGLNRSNVAEEIDDLRLRDAVATARRLQLPGLPDAWPTQREDCPRDELGIDRILRLAREDPFHPDNLRRRALNDAFSRPHARDAYWRMRRNLWNWPEFRTLKSTALRLLEIVIELAREEAFPWFVNVQAEHVMFLARFDRKTFFDRLRDLEALAITRPARRIHLFDDDARRARLPELAIIDLPRFPSAGNGWGVIAAEPLEDIPQWVIRYRRGIPGNARRAAWWINYDLLCETQRVLPCFEMSLNTLAPDYKQRNRWFGPREHGESEAKFKRMERSLAADGPPPPIGLRAALWEGLESSTG